MRHTTVLALTLAFLALPLVAQDKQPCSPVTDPNWMSKALMEIATIHVGMTRADLLKVFTPAGGFGTGNLFWHRKLPYIMVNVEFAPHNDSNKGAVEQDPTDTITSISKPFLDFPQYD